LQTLKLLKNGETMKLFKKLKGNKFINNIIIVASGTALAQIITFGLTPIITRIYGPTSFGVLGTFMAIINILGPVAALTYPIAIILPKKNGEARQIMKLSLFICVIFGIISGLVLLLTFDIIVDLFNLDLVAPFLFLVPLIIIFSGSFQIIEQWLIRNKQFSITAKTAVLQSIIVNSSKIGGGLLFPVSASLVLIQTFGIALRGALMLILSNKSIFNKEKLQQVSLKETAIKYIDFPLYRSSQVLFSSISQGLPIILLASFFGPIAAGFYSLGRQALGTPVQLFGKAVQDVLYPKISEVANRRENISKMIVKPIMGLAIIGIVPFGVIIAFGPTIFSVVFGGEWRGAGIYAQWIALMSLFMLIAKPAIVSIPVLKIQKQFLLFEIIGTVVKIGALSLGFYFFQSDVYAVAFFSIVSVILYISIIVYTLWIASRFNYREKTME